MSVKNIIWAYVAILVAALAACTLSGSAGAKEAVGWLFVAASAGAAVATWYLSERTDGLVRDFTRLLGIGFGSLAFTYLSYRIFPLADAPAFGDALWCTAFAVFFAAGVKGTMVIADLTFRDGRKDVWMSIGIGVAITVLMHFAVGLPALGDDASAGDVAIYRAGLIMMLVAMSTGALYIVLAVRSFGGQYGSMVILASAFNLLGGVADFVYGAIHPAVASGISPASTLVPMADASDWIRLASFVMIFVLVVRQLGQVEKERAAEAQPVAS